MVRPEQNWAASLGAEHGLGLGPAGVALAVASIVAGGFVIVPRGVRAALSGALDMNFLMSVAAVGAVAIGEHQEGASAMFLFSVAPLLESR